MKKIVTMYAAMIVVINFLLSSCGKSETFTVPQTPGTTDTSVNKPAIKGRLVYHSYTCYSCNDSKIYLYDFATNTNKLLSNNWNIDNPMNAHFSPDGKKIVFMGFQKGTDNWDVFLWTIDDAAEPTNLTAALGNSRDEDPKFSNAGNRIIFKHSGHVAEMDLDGNITRNITSGSEEESMPYYNYNDSLVLYAKGGGAASDIFVTDGTTPKPMAAQASLQEYYPIAKDSISFFYSRWSSTSNENDQVYLGYYNTTVAPKRLPFNTSDANYSDAYPCGDEYVIISSTKDGGKGSYDLYIANIATGKIWSMSLYNAAINSSKNELGAAFIGK